MNVADTVRSVIIPSASRRAKSHVEVNLLVGRSGLPRISWAEVVLILHFRVLVLVQCNFRPLERYSMIGP